MISDTDKLDAVTAHLALRPRITIMGVEYLHLQLEDGSDQYTLTTVEKHSSPKILFYPLERTGNKHYVTVCAWNILIFIQ